jgi:hypothetical protein
VRYQIDQSLNCGTTSQHFELAEGKTWADVQDWGVKWDTLHVTYDGENWSQIELNSNTEDVTDWKRPAHAQVHTVKDDECLYDNIAECET